MFSLYKLTRLAGFYNIYKTYFNQIYTPICLFSNINVRVTVFYQEDIPADIMPDKVVEKLSKLVNNWRWLYIYISAVQFKIQELCINVVIAMIFGS